MAAEAGQWFSDDDIRALRAEAWQEGAETVAHEFMLDPLQMPPNPYLGGEAGSGSPFRKDNS